MVLLGGKVPTVGGVVNSFNGGEFRCEWVGGFDLVEQGRCGLPALAGICGVPKEDKVGCGVLKVEGGGGKGMEFGKELAIGKG